MERESFEDEEVARQLNRGFVSIKVDREERPDIDHLYMEACMALNGSGGWPLSCFLTPDKKPFFAGTYFPKNDGRYGTGFLTLLDEISSLWRERRAEIGRSSDELLHRIGRQRRKKDVQGADTAAYRELSGSFDREWGGFSAAPKFPSPQNLLFLLRYGKLHPESESLGMVRKTLDAMASGGIYDQIGGGFCRYSTDRRWLIPHFEKMMIDNALHIVTYTEAAMLLDPKYARVTEDITAFCLREMLDPAGGFYTAIDADSEGVEGRFYLFSPDEIAGVLGEENGGRFCRLFGITREGNFEGKSVPTRPEAGFSGEDERFAEDCRPKVAAMRNRREPPFKDDKSLAQINGLMTAALAVEGRCLKKPAFLETARRCASFVLSSQRKNGRLLSRWRGGSAGIAAGSDDYACVIWGLLELYESTFEPEWLAAALELTRAMRPLFWDEAEDGYFLTGSDINDLPMRGKNLYDGAAPCGNSVMALNLLRLARLCAEPSFEEQAEQILAAMSGVLASYPAAGCGVLCAGLYKEAGGTEIILTGGDGFDALLERLPRFDPFTVTAACGTGFERAADVLPYLRGYPPADSKAAAYVCRGGSCSRPVSDPDELSALLSGS